MTTQMRISKVVIAALLGGGSACGLVVPNASHAQTGSGRPVEISLEVKQQIPEEQKKGRRVIGCDLLINVRNLPPGATIEFTDNQGRTHHVGPGVTCLSGQLAAAPPPVVVPPGGTTGGVTCTTTGGMTPTTICH